MHGPGPLPPESTMDLRGNWARLGTVSPVPAGIYPGPRSGKTLSYFPSITSQTFCSKSQDSIVTMPAVKTAAFPRQLGWSCLCMNMLCFCAYWTDAVLSLQLHCPEKRLLDWLAFCLWMPKSTLRFNTGFYYWNLLGNFFFFTSLPRLIHSALAPTSKSRLHGVAGPRTDDVISFFCSLSTTQFSQTKGKCWQVPAGAVDG